MLNVFGNSYGQVLRLKRKVYNGKFSPPGSYFIVFGGYIMFFDVNAREPHPRRALIVSHGHKTPVNIKGK